MSDRNYSDERMLMAYVDSMIAERGAAEGLSNEERDALRRVLFEELNDAMEKAMLMALPDEKLAELERILDENGSDEVLEEFFDGTDDIDMTPAIEAAMEKFREDYLAGEIEVDITAELERVRAMRAAMAADDGEGVVQSPGDTPLTEEEYARIVGMDDAAMDTDEVTSVDGMADESMEPVQGTSSEVQGWSDVEGNEVNGAENAMLSNEEMAGDGGTVGDDVAGEWNAENVNNGEEM